MTYTPDFLPSGRVRCTFPETSQLLYEIKHFERWRVENDPEQALESRLFFDRMSWAAFLKAVGC